MRPVNYCGHVDLLQNNYFSYQKKAILELFFVPTFWNFIMGEFS